MNQSEFRAITCNLLKGREKLCVQGLIGFGFASHGLKTRARFSSRSQGVANYLRQSFENYFSGNHL